MVLDLTKYPGKIPIILTKHPGSDVPLLKKSRYLVNADVSVGEFIFLLRNMLKIKASDAIFIYCAGTLLSGTEIIERIWSKYRNLDNVLYITYSAESAFG